MQVDIAQNITTSLFDGLRLAMELIEANRSYALAKIRLTKSLMALDANNAKTMEDYVQSKQESDNLDEKLISIGTSLNYLFGETARTLYESLNNQSLSNLNEDDWNFYMESSNCLVSILGIKVYRDKYCDISGIQSLLIQTKELMENYAKNPKSLNIVGSINEILNIKQNVDEK